MSSFKSWLFYLGFASLLVILGEFLGGFTWGESLALVAFSFAIHSASEVHYLKDVLSGTDSQ